MAIKIENRTEDDIIITCFGKEIEILNGEDAVFENDGRFSLTVRRKRVPEFFKASKSKLPAFEQDNTPKSHIQLRGEFEIEPNSSKTVVTVTPTARLFDTLHEDAIFVGYKAEVSGGKIISYKERFATDKVKNQYKSKQMLNTIFPVGVVGIAILVIGIISLVRAFGGNMLVFFGNEIDMVYASLMTAAGVLVTGVFMSNFVKILKRVKEYS